MNNLLSNRLIELRKANNLTQNEFASMLGITNKAVSKWENGNANPTIEELVKISKIFNVSIDELTNGEVNCDNKKIYKIAITGGPCSGKSTALGLIQTEFAKMGYMVLVVPETATELILGGVSPWTMDTIKDFQTSIIKLQVEKEKVFYESAKNINSDKILIVCDRGTIDGKSYMNEYEFNMMIKKLGYSEIELRDSYDAVFHLVTAAKGAEDYYNNDNNKARYESIEEAIIQDEKTLNAWIGHPHLRVIDNSKNFDDKLRRLITEISNFLGEPNPYEIERKFLIKYPNLDYLEKIPNCSKVEIVQTYLKSFGDFEVRLRQRGQNGHYIYTKTSKQFVSPMKRIEIEQRLTKDEYLNLLLEADTTKKQIRKTRYCLTYHNQYFEIDVYPFWKDKAIMEIELRTSEQIVDLPKFIKVIKEVTNDKNYYNFALASVEEI